MNAVKVLERAGEYEKHAAEGVRLSSEIEALQVRQAALFERRLQIWNAMDKLRSSMAQACCEP